MSRAFGERAQPGERSAGSGTEVLVRPFRAGDEAALLAAFNRCFAAIDPSFEPRPMEEWRWRYERNPAGRRIVLAFGPGGEVIGQQAGTPIRVLHDGRLVTWNQVGDTFVDPRWARALRKPGLFYRVARPFSDLYGGAPPRQDPFLYGLPTRRAHRIGAAQLGYATIRNQNRLVAPAGALARGRSGGVEVEEVRAVPETIAELFLRYAAGRRAVAVRDRTYLVWRYLERPTVRYELALARRRAPGGARELAGLAVYRAGGFDGRETGLLCDWVVAPGDRDAGAALCAWLGARAAADGLPDVTAVLPEPCPEFRALQRAGFRVRPTGYYLVGRTYAGPYPMPWIYAHWTYGLGDFDLC